MRKYQILLVILVFISFRSYSTEPPSIREGDFEQLKITRQEAFNSSELWGLINGGADLYFEYGFDKLLLQEISIGAEQFRIEIYHMIDEPAAFGIYSVSVHRCIEMGRLHVNDCINAYQVQMAIGNIYASIINYTGSESARETSVEIAGKLIRGVRFDGQNIKYFSRSESGKEVITRIYRGILGIQNGNSNWLELFRGLEGFTMSEITVKDANGEFRLAGVECGDREQAEMLKQRVAMAGLIPVPAFDGEEELGFIDTSGYNGDYNEILKELGIEV